MKLCLFVFIVTKNYVSAFAWSDGSSVNYVNWEANQPDNYRGTENCVEMGPNTGHWNDANCYARRNWICMIKRGNNSKTSIFYQNLAAYFTQSVFGCHFILHVCNYSNKCNIVYTFVCTVFQFCRASSY